MDECKPLDVGTPDRTPETEVGLALRTHNFRSFTRGLHSLTFQLNLSALYGTGGAHRGCVARVQGVLGGV